LQLTDLAERQAKVFSNTNKVSTYLQIYNKLKLFSRFYKSKVIRFFKSFTFSQETYLLVLGGIIGLLSGYAAVAYKLSIRIVKNIFFDLPGHFFGVSTLLGYHTWLSSIILICIPAIGGLLVGILAKYFQGARKGEGIPTTIDAVASRGGVIKGSTGFLKTLGAVISLGTGGAGGNEGPVVMVGSSIASSLGRYLSVSPDRLKILVGCGAAAGLAAAYNAPLGGALFSMEIILRTFNAKSFSPIIIASVFATVVSRSYLGAEPAFKTSTFHLISNYEFIFYAILGILAAFTAVYFVRGFMKIDEYFDDLKKIPIWLKPAIGGLFVGMIGLYLPGIFSFSEAAVDNTIFNATPFVILILMLLFKPIATSFTIGSGGNGGTFSPSIFTGAMLGGAFGQAVNYFFPAISAPPGAYALVGMAAVVAGTTHASLTALIMVFEMTDNYRIILPLMLTIIISTTISKAILKGSLYTLKFDKEGKGIDIYGRKVSVLKNMPIRNLLENNTDIVNQNTSFKQVLDAVKASRFNYILVKNSGSRVVGKIAFEDLRDAVLDEETRGILDFLVAGDLMTKEIVSITNDANSETALNLLEKEDLDYVPVVDKENGNYIGIVSKQNILKKYQNELFVQQSEHDLALG
jgi:chloride channel protein, CIC family